MSIEPNGTAGQQAEAGDWQDFVASGVAMALTLFFLFASYQLSEKARMVPLLALYANLVFVSLDLLGRTPTRVGRAIRRTLLNNAPPTKLLNGYLGASVSREAGATALVLAFYAVVQFFGILPTVPVFVLAYMTLWSKKKLRLSLSAATIITVIVWILFEQVLGVSLYRGLLFES
jgi:hypothetical protein